MGRVCVIDMPGAERIFVLHLSALHFRLFCEDFFMPISSEFFSVFLSFLFVEFYCAHARIVVAVIVVTIIVD